ncbi:hypothetical protein [Microbacterium sp.]|uniref:hypothetical protein n=1 Tax=Microbacterium sp. TaxID=51671 RepID=UPI003A952018
MLALPPGKTASGNAAIWYHGGRGMLFQVSGAKAAEKTVGSRPGEGGIMPLNKYLIALIARINPQIWEIVGGGPGGGIRIGGFHETVELNPQPLPPKAVGAVSPGLHYGAGVGAELVRIATTAHVLHVAFEPGDDICPPPRKHPPIPWPFPPEPYPWRTADFDIEYAAGLAFALEATADAWGALDGADGLQRVHDVAMKTAMAGGERAND